MKLIDISTKSHPNVFAMVDDDDFDHLSQWKWSVEKRRNTCYAIRCVRRDGKKTTIRMHVEIMGRQALDIDHRDRNGLNNQRSNLRSATETQNMWNVAKWGGKTSKYKGVSWCQKYGRWKSHIRMNGKRVYLGSYATEELAAAAYNYAVLRERGKEFGVINEGISIPEEIVKSSRLRNCGSNRGGRVVRGSEG